MIHEPTEAMDPAPFGPTVAEIDLDQMASNYRAIDQAVGRARLLPVIKANAYGHGLLPVARRLERLGPAGLAVAFLEEGVLLRKGGIRCPILVMGGLDIRQIPRFLEHDLTITASAVHQLPAIDVAAARLGVTARVHLKVDTGMGRIGVRPEEAPALFEAGLAARRVEVEGVYSHLATADGAEPGQTLDQLARFRRAVSFYADRGLPVPRLHIANSGGILQYPGSHLDLVRPGIMLFGVYPSPEVRRTVEVAPVLTWKSRIVYSKTQPAGHPVSYGATWAPERDTRIVTIPTGYGDGYHRLMSRRAEVLIGGRRRPVVGRICMDQMMVDVGPDGEDREGDEVVLIGSQGNETIYAHDLARWASTIPYETLTSINSRVARRYVPEGVTS